MPPGPSVLCRLALALGAASALLVPGAALADQAEVACRESFARFQRAFEARSAEAVVGCMPAEGTLTLSLIGVAGRVEPMKREQAQKVLKTYFELLTSATLKAREGQPADALVRAFDFVRRLRAGDPSTTRLTVTLKKDATGAPRLHSLVESAR